MVVNTNMDKNSLIRSLQSNRIQQLQSSNKPQMPSATKMAVNLGKSVVNNAASVMAGNALKTDSEQANSRLSICRGCEFFDSGSERCGKCGCNMAVKTYLRAEKCPIDKW
jgi:hypothetical protein